MDTTARRRPLVSSLRPPQPRSSRGRWPAALTAAALATTVLLTGLPAQAATAPASPGSGELRERVADLTAQVEQLEVAAEVAAEAWNGARAELDVLLGQEVQAQVGMDEAGRALEAERGAAARRVRALYRSGGTFELAWTALHGSGFADAATTYRTARVVLDADAVAVERAGLTVDEAVASSTEVQRLRRERAVLEAEAASHQGEVEAALLAREGLLAGTDDALVAAVERERLAAEQAAVAYALAQAQEQARAQASAAAVATPAATPAAAAAAAAAERSTTSSQAVAGPAGGTVPAGFVGGSVDQQQIVEAAAAKAPNTTAAAAIRAAATRLGLPYVWGATGPGTFDCSGLTMWAYRQAGLAIPRTSRQQYAGLPKIAVAELLPGDLVFYASGSAPSSIHHVSMYLGDGLILTAPRAGDVVKISAVWRKPIYGAVRPTD